MSPDYNAMVNEFIKPVASFFLFAFLILGWVTAFMLKKENTILRIKLGKEEERIKEGFKIWVLRKSAPIIFPLYSAKTYSFEKQFQPLLKHVVKNKSKILKLAFRLQIVISIILTALRIASARITWEVRKQ